MSSIYWSLDGSNDRHGSKYVWMDKMAGKNVPYVKKKGTLCQTYTRPYIKFGWTLLQVKWALFQVKMNLYSRERAKKRYR